MKVVILAAGYAIRLHPMTLNTSKSLLSVGGKKMIDRILDKIAAMKNAASSICIVTNDKFYGSFNGWLMTSFHRKKTELLNDGTTANENRLGAVQDLEFAIKSKKIDDDLLVIAGDNLFDFDLDRFIEFAKGRADGVSVALHDIKKFESARSFGVVEIDVDEKVVDFEEKPEKPKSTLISCGIYYFPKEKLSLIEEYVKQQNKLDAPGYYISWMSKVDRVYGFTFLEDWYDIGNIESYEKADREYRKKESAER
ncbi:MAG: nucleotidyltransferase family protein [Candidatus Omnitrophota bacterium]|nr:nucleotidyltransferase family protein [Candidatus Omnitrophota bacterium]